MKNKIKLTLLMLTVWYNTYAQADYVEYSSSLNGEFMCQNCYGDADDEIIISSLGSLFSVTWTLTEYDSEYDKFDTQSFQGKVFLGGMDEDETFVQFEGSEDAYSIWFEMAKSGEITCYITFDYDEPQKYLKEKPINTSNQSQSNVESSNLVELPSYIESHNWYENFRGECYMSDRGGDVRIDGDGVDKFIGYIQIFNEGYDENGDGEYIGDNEMPPYMDEFYIQGKTGVKGVLLLNIWTKMDVDYFEYSKEEITKSDMVIVFRGEDYSLIDCR